MNSRKIIKILEREGWRLVDTKGSHNQYKHPEKKGRVTAPHPKRDFSVGTISSIFQQAEIDRKKFKK